MQYYSGFSPWEQHNVGGLVDLSSHFSDFIHLQSLTKMGKIVESLFSVQ